MENSERTLAGEDPGDDFDLSRSNEISKRRHSLRHRNRRRVLMSLSVEQISHSADDEAVHHQGDRERGEF
jgi:hypothetical protein